MKKYILLTAIAANLTIQTPALANSVDKFYLKTAIGLNYISTQKIEDNQLKGRLKLKSNFPVVSLGVGYEFSNLVRLEAMLDYYFQFQQKERTQSKLLSDKKYNIDIDTKISDIMISAYKGLKLTDKVVIFAGGGIGVSSIKDKSRGYIEWADGSLERLEHIKNKTIYSFAYKLSTGLEYQLENNIKLDLAYSFYNLGTNKPKKIREETFKKRNFHNHNLMLGLRFKI
jgi:opacity protein-like surface antigen